MNYTEAIEYIHSVNWMFCNPGLDRVKTLCHALGDPQDSLKFIHVAGTNGKGSFCAMTDSILRAQGYRVGLFTSPYIMEFGERMRVDGENISEDELCSLVERVKPIADAMEDKPTEFELITALAFLYFAEKKCDYVVLECGLGGRLDATNVIKTPILSVITGIALDHTAILGDTEEKIAAEKAGIIKSGVPVLWCGSHAGAENVISQKAAEVGSKFVKIDRSTMTVNKTTLDGTDFDFEGYKDMHIPLLGSYQPLNAANALTAIDLLREMGVEIGEDAIKKGLADVVWHARFEVICKDPLIIADGGHNPEGIDGAVESVKQYFREKVGIVTGVMADKDYKYMAGRMAEVAERVFCLTPDNPRALAAEDYARVFEALDVSSEAFGSVDDAVKAAATWGRENNLPVICLGSLYMYGEVIRSLE
jgi:dihydrofolate synthase/folylpolyglutamate synthase